MKLIRKNPNASAAAGLGTVGVLLSAAAKALGYELDQVIVVAAAGAITTVGLFIGRKGLRGLVRLVWRGSEDAGE